MSAIGVMKVKRALEKVDLLPFPEYLKIAEKKYNLSTTDPAVIEKVKLEL